MARTKPDTIKEYNKRQSDKVKAWRKRTKMKLIASMGGCCQICSYNRCHKALELHHIDATQKEKSFSQLMARPTAIAGWFEEFKKCILLCANCHREIHENLVDMPEEYVIFNEDIFNNIDESN